MLSTVVCFAIYLQSKTTNLMFTNYIGGVAGRFPKERGRWTISKLDYKLRKCTLCNSGDHVTLVCEQFADARKKYLKKYFYRRPSMAKFVELMNTKSDRERYRLMLYVNIVLKEYETISAQR